MDPSGRVVREARYAENARRERAIEGEPEACLGVIDCVRLTRRSGPFAAMKQIRQQRLFLFVL